MCVKCHKVHTVNIDTEALVSQLVDGEHDSKQMCHELTMKTGQTVCITLLIAKNH